MKKFFLPLLAVLLVLGLCSCRTAVGEPFAVFDGDFFAELSLDVEGNSCALKYIRAEQCAEFTAPAELSGYKLRLDGEKVYISFDKTEVAVSEYAGRISFILDAVFSQDSDAITKISAQDTENGTLTEVKTACFSYIFLPDGMPASVEGEYDGVSFKIAFSSFTGAMK